MADILLIEDDLALQEAYSFILDTDGHNVTSAYNGQEGLDKIKSSTYEIILLDIHMPVMNGLQFLENFKDNRPPETKVIVFSNMVEPEIEKRAVGLGADACILKSSMTPGGMLACVKEHTAPDDSSSR